MSDPGQMRPQRRIAILSALAGTALLTTAMWIGCSRSSKTEDPDTSGDPNNGPARWTEASIKPSGDPWSGAVQVTTGDWAAFQKLVDSHKGKVVVAGFWASWSEKIVPQIRQLARLQNKYPGKIIVIQVAVDPETSRPKLEKLVRAWVGPEIPADGTVRLFISSQVDEEFYAAAKSIEAVPTIFVYDQKGVRTKVFLGAEKVIDCGEHLIPLLNKLLK